MGKKNTYRILAMFLVFVMICGMMPSMKNEKMVEAASLSYPAQTVKIGAYKTNKNLNITGYGAGSSLNIWIGNGEQNENWRIDYVSSGVYKLVNVKTGLLATASGNSVVLQADSNSTSQYWYITGTDKDFLGEYLFYKITSYASSSKAITFNASSNSASLTSYSGATTQKWKLNLNGLEGFAGNCKVSEGEKAGTIGGLLGQTVYVSDLASLKSALLNTSPMTIVITSNITNCNSETYDLRIEDYKTIIGSYSAKTLVDPRLRTDDYFKKEKVSNNIVLSNLDISIKNREDVVAFAVYGSDNVWVDHCTFNSSLTCQQDEVGKFIWVNKSEYANKNPDFCTLSYNDFMNRFWCIAYGADNTSEDRASVMYNYFESIVHRAPQLGNGTLHVYNNYYVRNKSSVNNDGLASIKCGAGSVVYSEANRFQGYRKESSGYWDYEYTVDSSAKFIDVNSYTNKTAGGSSSATPYLMTSSSNPAKYSYTTTSWKPYNNYGYEVIRGYNSNGSYDTKAFCTAYSGCVSSSSNLKYIKDSDCSSYVSYKYSSPVYSN